MGAEKSTGCPRCGKPLHRLSRRFYRCDLAHLSEVEQIGPAVFPPAKPGADS